MPIDYATMIKVFIATAAWTSGQHWDALRPLAIALYGIPVLAALAFAVMRCGRTIRVHLTSLAVIAAAFALAQLINAAGYIRLARAAGSALPAGGKEGWYWYVLAPVAVTMLLGLAIEKLARPASVALISWLLIWDVLITEGALFHDYAGATSPLHSSVLFRWGPLLPPFTANLSEVAVGPFARGLIALRFLHLVAAGVLIVVVLRSARKPVATSVPAL